MDQAPSLCDELISSMMSDSFENETEPSRLFRGEPP